jgi:hypothetical protein
LKYIHLHTLIFSWILLVYNESCGKVWEFQDFSFFLCFKIIRQGFNSQPSQLSAL